MFFTIMLTVAIVTGILLTMSLIALIIKASF